MSISCPVLEKRRDTQSCLGDRTWHSTLTQDLCFTVQHRERNFTKERREKNVKIGVGSIRCSGHVEVSLLLSQLSFMGLNRLEDGEDEQQNGGAVDGYLPQDAWHRVARRAERCFRTAPSFHYMWGPRCHVPAVWNSWHLWRESHNHGVVMPPKNQHIVVNQI